MRKFLVSVLAVVMILNTLMISSFAADTINTVKIDDELVMANTVLQYLNITDDTVEDSATVSRAEFAMLSAKLVGYVDSVDSHYAYYTDVPVNNIYCGYISHLADRKAVSIPEDRIFNPDSSITLEQAYKILFSLAGYGYYIDEFYGGFPQGYVYMAKKLKLDIAPLDVNALNYGEVKKLLFKFGNLNVMVYGVENNVSNDKTLLAMNYSLYMGEGIVNETYVNSTGNMVTDTDSVVIDKTKYSSGDVVANDFFLDRVEFAYVYDMHSEVRTLIAMKEISWCNEELIVSCYDIISFNDSSYTLSYYKDGRKKDVSASGATVIYNGRIVTGKPSKYINRLIDKTYKGTVTFKKYTGEYEYIIIDAYQSGVISQVDRENRIIYDRNQNYFITDLTQYDNVYIKNAAGQVISEKNLAKGDIFSIAASADGKILKIVQGTDRVVKSVQIKSINNGEYELLLDDKTVIKLDKYYMDKYGKNINLNSAYDLYVDIFGEIVNMEKSSASTDEFKIGYLIDAAYTTKGMYETGEMKILDSDGTINIYTLAEKPTIDRMKYKHVIPAMNAIPGTTGIVDLSNYNNPANRPVLESQLIRYKLRALPGSVNPENENGEKTGAEETAKYEIFEIDTDKCTDLEIRKDTLNCFREKERLGYEYVLDNNLGRFSRDVLVDPNKTIVFNVPLLQDGYCVEVSESFWDAYSMSIFKDINGNPVRPTDDLYYMGMNLVKQRACHVEAYNIKADSIYADVVVLHRSAKNAKSDPFMVAEKITTLGKDGSPVQAIRGLAKTGEQWRYFPMDYDLSDINVGDLIRVDVNRADGNASKVKKVFDVKTLSYVGSTSSHISYYNDNIASKPAGIADNGYYQTWQLTKGYAINHDDSWIRISYDLPDNEIDFDEVVQILGKKPIIYDSSLRENNAYFGTADEIVDYDVAGRNCSFVVSYSKSQQLQDNVFIYK